MQYNPQITRFCKLTFYNRPEHRNMCPHDRYVYLSLLCSGRDWALKTQKFVKLSNDTYACNSLTNFLKICSLARIWGTQEHVSTRPIRLLVFIVL